MKQPARFGKKNAVPDARMARVLIRQAETAGLMAATDHGQLAGLADDDHAQYVHLSVARTIEAVHTFNPPAAGAPFALSPNAQGQLVTGLKADQLNKSVLVSGLGLSGGGALTADRTITLASSSNPGAAASILASDASGHLTLVRLNTDTIADKSGGSLTISPAGDVVLDPAGNDVYPNANYDLNLGLLTKKFLTLHAAELWVETLVAQNTIATIGGRILVGPTTTLTRDLGDGAGDTTIYVKHNQMANGDTVYLEANAKVEFMLVTSGATLQAEGDYSYTVTRNRDGSGRNLWYAGDAVFNTGAAGDGWIDLYSVAGVASVGVGPSIVGNVRNSATYNDWTARWVIGNLNGHFGIASSYYGVGLGDYAGGNYLRYENNGGFVLRAGGNTTSIDGNGTTITASNSYTDVRAYKFTDGTNILGGLYGLYSGTDHYLKLAASSIANEGSHLLFISEAPVNRRATLLLQTTGGGSNELYMMANADGSSQFKLTAGDDLVVEVGDNAGANKFVVQSADDTACLTVYSNGNAFINDTSNAKATLGLTINQGGADNAILDFKSSDVAHGGNNYAETDTFAQFTKAWPDLGGVTIWGFKKADATDANRTRVVRINALTADATASVTKGASGLGLIHFLCGVPDGSGGFTTVPADGNLFSVANWGSTRLLLDADGDLEVFNSILINDTSNAKLTRGLTINQGAADDEIVSLKSSDVAHGITDITETDTYGLFDKAEATSGGLRIRGLKDADGSAGYALYLEGLLGEAADTTKSTAGIGVTNIGAAVKSGTGITNVGADGNLLAIRNYGTTAFIFDAEGSAFADVGWTTFDEHDDTALLAGLEGAMLAWKDPVRAEFAAMLRENRAELERLNLVHFDDAHPGHAMLNLTRLSMLLAGAVRQVGRRCERLETALLRGGEYAT